MPAVLAPHPPLLAFISKILDDLDACLGMLQVWIYHHRRDWRGGVQFRTEFNTGSIQEWYCFQNNNTCSRSCCWLAALTVNTYFELLSTLIFVVDSFCEKNSLVDDGDDDGDAGDIDDDDDGEGWGGDGGNGGDSGDGGGGGQTEIWTSSSSSVAALPFSLGSSSSSGVQLWLVMLVFNASQRPRTLWTGPSMADACECFHSGENSKGFHGIHMKSCLIKMHAEVYRTFNMEALFIDAHSSFSHRAFSR